MDEEIEAKLKECVKIYDYEGFKNEEEFRAYQMEEIKKTNIFREKIKTNILKNFPPFVGEYVIFDKLSKIDFPNDRIGKLSDIVEIYIQMPECACITCFFRIYANGDVLLIRSLESKKSFFIDLNDEYNKKNSILYNSERKFFNTIEEAVGYAHITYKNIREDREAIRPMQWVECNSPTEKFKPFLLVIKLYNFLQELFEDIKNNKIIF